MPAFGGHGEFGEAKGRVIAGDGGRSCEGEAIAKRIHTERTDVKMTWATPHVTPAAKAPISTPPMGPAPVS